MRAESEVELSTKASDVQARPSPSRISQPVTKHAANVIFIIIAIVALFWRVFFLGETLIDVNTLNNQLPWGYSAGESDYPYNRRDLTDTYVTREYFVVASYRDGEFPLWNPYTMAGHPIYADGVTRTLSPLLLLYKFFDIPLGYSLARLIELMLAAILMYIFLVSLGASADGGLLGSLVFAFSAHSMLHLTGLGWWGGLMWLPLIFLFVDRAIQRKSYTQAMLAGVCLAAQFFCGYLPNQIYYVGAVFLYYGFFAFITRRNSISDRSIVQVIAMMAVTLATGLALSATQWLPSLELLSYSNRRIVGSELGYVYLPPWYLVTLVFPNFFGTAYDAKLLKLFTALGVSHDHILYLGIAALAPLSFVLWRLRQDTKSSDAVSSIRGTGGDAVRQRIMFFVVLAGLSLVLMMAAPLYVYITRFIPVLQVIRVAVRAGVLFLFAACVLVAFGTDLLFQAAAESLGRFARLARKFAIAVAVFVTVAMTGSYLSRLAGLSVQDDERGRLAFMRRSVLALSAQLTPPNPSIIIPLVLVFTVVALLWLLGQRRLEARTFFFLMVSMLLVELFWNSNQFDHTFNRSRVFPRTEITDLLQSLPRGRVLVVPSGLETNRGDRAGAEKIIAPPNTLLAYGISTVTGKNQQFPRWYRDFASLIERQLNPSHVVFEQNRSNLFDLLNVKYVITYKSAPHVSEAQLLATAEGLSLYENKSARPRAFFASAVSYVGPKESLTRMKESNFEPDRETIIELDQNDDRASFPATSAAPQTAASANIILDSRNRVSIETDNSRDGLLVLSDNYYPGWKAYVDGLPTRIFRANHTMRAINIPAGHHLISFVFAPPAFFSSMYVSLVAGVLTFAFLANSLIRRARRVW